MKAAQLDGPEALAHGSFTIPAGMWVPKYVRACCANAWHVVTWDTRAQHVVGIAPTKVTPFRCRSWRCPRCRKFRAAQDFARLHEACDGQTSQTVAMMVLTFDQSAWKRRGLNEAHAYKALYRMWTELRRRLVRVFGYAMGATKYKEAMELGRFDYCATIERHRNGWPHLQVMLVGEPMRLLQGHGWRRLRREVLNPLAMACGFGRRFYIAPARSVDDLGGYMVKVAGRMEDAPTGEIAKVSQVPWNTPPHFRRLRASRGFLPPTHRPDPDRTGALVQRYQDRKGKTRFRYHYERDRAFDFQPHSYGDGFVRFFDPNERMRIELADESDFILVVDFVGEPTGPPPPLPLS